MTSALWYAAILLLGVVLSLTAGYVFGAPGILVVAVLAVPYGYFGEKAHERLTRGRQ